jgi:hypothetical protein
MACKRKRKKKFLSLSSQTQRALFFQPWPAAIFKELEKEDPFSFLSFLNYKEKYLYNHFTQTHQQSSPGALISSL